MIPTVFIIASLVMYSLYQFKIIDVKLAIIGLISIVSLSFGLGIFGFLLQTAIHIINGLLQFAAPIIMFCCVLWIIHWIERNFPEEMK